MEKHVNHQIDELAQRVLTNALPKSWVVNSFQKDYGKDYHVDVADENGKLTGVAFYIQLKGQQKAKYNKRKSEVLFRLGVKHASYYLDKLKDLPVFLVVVDTGETKGWWLHVQPILGRDTSWRKAKSVQLRFPVANTLKDIDRLIKAVMGAHREMRLLHPQAIRDAVTAQVKLVRETDPRFDATVTVAQDGSPRLHLKPMEAVALKLHVLGSGERIKSKITELFDRGGTIDVEPGEVRISGSKLFDTIEHFGGQLSAVREVHGTVSLIAAKDGVESARIADIPGKYTGGSKELWFEGSLRNSPLTVSLGPLAIDVAGSTKVNLAINKWDGQKLCHLAYFERIYAFITAVQDSPDAAVALEINGNTTGTLPIKSFSTKEMGLVYDWLTWISKARKVAAQFNVDPDWLTNEITEEWEKDIEELYAIHFNGGYREATPFKTQIFSIDKSTIRFTDELAGVSFMSTWTYHVLAETIQIQLVHYISDVIIKPPTDEQRKGRPNLNGDAIDVVMVGTKSTMTIVRLATEADE
jgi:hypothetical protein